MTRHFKGIKKPPFAIQHFQKHSKTIYSTSTVKVQRWPFKLQELDQNVYFRPGLDLLWYHRMGSCPSGQDENIWVQ